MRAPSARILVVDDDPAVLNTHRKVLERAGYAVETASDGPEALVKLLLGVDLVLLDAEMPYMDGFEVARAIRSEPQHTFLPIIMITGLAGAHDQRRAMESGINDFIIKPAERELMLLRCEWLLELKRAQDSVLTENEELKQEVERQSGTLRGALEKVTAAQRHTYEAHLDTIRRLTVAAEYKDHDTAGHIERIGVYAEAMARALSMSSGESQRLSHAAPMHDVGKLGIPDSILLKPASLTEDEWVIMRAHTTMGADLLAGSPSPVIRLGESIAITHHERWDGTGYPNGLKGEDIPIEGRICAIVDYFDALSMDRPYRRAVPVEEVFRLIQDESGAHFDPYIVRVFMQLRNEILEIQKRQTRSPVGRTPRGT